MLMLMSFRNFGNCFGISEIWSYLVYFQLSVDPILCQVKL